jgi:hypothetical protein
LSFFGQIARDEKASYEMTDLLTRLRANDFGESLGFVLPPAAMRIGLQREPTVRQITMAIRRGEISEAMIRRFVNSLASEFQEGRSLPGDLAFAALAVALEQILADYAEEFLCDLARLRLAEMTVSIRVARECLRNRYLLPKNQVRISKYQSAKIIPTRTFVSETPRVIGRNRLPKVSYRDFAGAR